MKSTRGATHSSYLIGFGLSVALTLLAYVLVVEDVLPKTALIVTIVGLAIVQLFVQLYFFLHLGHETKPRWKLVVFGFMAMVLLILVIGSLWIMYSLDYHMTMPPEELDAQIIEDEGYRPY